MKITVNGELIEIKAETLDGLCTQLGYESDKIATALNGDFVPISRRDFAVLNDNDHVEIVAPRQGG